MRHSYGVFCEARGVIWLFVFLVVCFRAMVWLFLALATIAIGLLAAIPAVIGAPIGLRSERAAAGWRDAARGLWAVTLALGVATDAHRNWVLPNRPPVA